MVYYRFIFLPSLQEAFLCTQCIGFAFHCSKSALNLKLVWNFMTNFHVNTTGKTCTLQVVILLLWVGLWENSMHLEIVIGAPWAMRWHWTERRWYLCCRHLLEISPKSSSGSCLLGIKVADGMNACTGWCVLWCKPQPYKSHIMIYHLVSFMYCGQDEKPTFLSPVAAQEAVLRGSAALIIITELGLQCTSSAVRNSRWGRSSSSVPQNLFSP